MEIKRICIYPKDIMRITGKSASACRKTLSDIKKHYSKKPSQLITIQEFCGYLGLKEEEIEKYLRD